MIRSTKVTTKFANVNKRQEIHQVIDEYRRVVGIFVDKFWKMDKVPTLVPKSVTSEITTWLSARMIQAAGKQASGIVRGTRKKYENRIWMINKLRSEGRHKPARRLQAIHDKKNLSKPNIQEVQPELDSRFVKVDIDNPTSFDGWLTLGSIGDKKKIVIPFKKTKHFNKLLAQGTLKTGVRLSKKSLTFMFDLPEPETKNSGETLGLDIGYLDILTLSDGQHVVNDRHGHSLASICQRLARKQKGSKGFKKTQDHRRNFIRWSAKQLSLDKTKEVRVENFKHLRRGRRTKRNISHWNYADIFDVVNEHFSTRGVRVTKVSSPFTSQRCSACGWVRKRNRKCKQFTCDSCGNTLDADLNAARNIALGLPPVGVEKRLDLDNRKGFYWNGSSEERIVPHARKLFNFNKKWNY